MTAGNHGAGMPPEDDDPFAHLYRPDGGGAPPQGPPQGPPAGPPGDGTAPIRGVPRTSYTQVRAVGERTYGQQVPPQQGYAPYAQGSPHYAAPETYPGAAPRPPYPDDGYNGYDGYDGYDGYADGPGGPGRRGGRGGGGRGGLMLGAFAVVVTVVIAIVAAVLFSGDGESSDDVSGDGTSAAPSGGADKNGDKKPPGRPGALPTTAADELTTGGGAVVGEDPKVSEDGPYVHGFLKSGPFVSWDPELAKAGQYYLYVDYSVPGKDADMTLTVNGEPQSRPLNMANFTGAKKNDWLSGWTRTFAIVQLDKGANDIKLSCEDTNSNCQSAISEVYLSDKELAN